MSRNTNASPGSIILARIDKNLARCGDCGLGLWRICGDRLEDSIDEGVKGWRAVDGVLQATPYHQRQRQRARMHLYDFDLPGAKRIETRDRLKRNQFGQGVSHTGEPASRTELEQLPKEQNTANKILLDLCRLGVMQGVGVSTDEETVTVFDGPESGVYQKKSKRNASQLSPSLVHALQLPAKVKCPRCGAVNLITDS